MEGITFRSNQLLCVHIWVRGLLWACLCLSYDVVWGANLFSRYTEPYPSAFSKKGLQVELVEDALELGVKHATLNLNLAQLIAPQGGSDKFSWTENGKVFFFEPKYLERMDRDIKALSDKGVLVNIIVLAYHSGNREIDRILLHPGYSEKAPNKLGAFNTVKEEGRDWFQACMGFLSERWSRPDRNRGRVVGYIIGNEVNSHWFWANMGHVSMEVFADDYLRTVRIAHQAIRSQSSWARVYISLEHHWMIHYPPAKPSEAFAGRPFLDYFASRAKAGGDFDWHLAFHPYPENLFEPRFWLDKTAEARLDTPRITFKNLEILEKWMDQPSMRYRDDRRRVILSEQGFHGAMTPEGELRQAAAYCYAYRKVVALPGIDNFILHRHVDHPAEGGLLLGLRSMVPRGGEPRPRKRIYDCFRFADTANWEEHFRFALPVIGLSSWGEVLPLK